MNVDLTNKIASWYGVIIAGLLTCYSLPSQPEPQSKWYCGGLYLVVSHLGNAGTCLGLQVAYDQKVQWHQGGSHVNPLWVNHCWDGLCYPSHIPKLSLPEFHLELSKGPMTYAWVAGGRCFPFPKARRQNLGQKAGLASVTMTLCTAAWSGSRIG